MDKNAEYFLIWLKNNDPDNYYLVVDSLRQQAQHGLGGLWDNLSTLANKLPDLANNVQKYNLQTQQLKDMKANTKLMASQQQQALLQQQQAGQAQEYNFLNAQGMQDTLKKLAIPLVVGLTGLLFVMNRKKSK